MNATVTVTTSSHPDFELFATATVNGRQLATRGNRAQVDSWVGALRVAAERAGWNVTVRDEAAA